jgi:hypothetical protein
VKVGVDACSEKVGIGASSGLKVARVVLADLVKKSVVIVVPHLVSSMVEAELSGGTLDDNVSVMSHSLINIGKGVHEVICEDLITNSGRAKAV